MKLLTFIAIALSISLSSGCISTQVRGYTDTKYSAYKISSIAVLAISNDPGLSEAIEKSLVEKFSSKSISAVQSTILLPPTRNYTVDEIKKILLSQDVHSLLIIQVGSSKKTSEIIGYQTYGYAYGTASGSTYSTGNTAYTDVSGSVSSSSTTYAQKSFNRDTITSSRLYDVTNAEIVWTALAETEAGGAVFMSDSSTGKSISTTIIDDLVSKGHLN